ncbi:MAG TPA: macro domain-containing protein [Candidatus Sulfotelmatobacter sp.]|nr:macro domain-containing protein [Candidatus Sulfotelmatobacter sp.]
MIKYVEGNLLEAPTEALVNTVNEVGVMGKGIALMFREAFPEASEAYVEACKEGRVRVGHMFVTENKRVVHPRWIINFPTKKHWRGDSRIEWIREGLQDLVRVIRERKIHSIAIPPLGCGNGGLDWPLVQQEIETALEPLSDVEVWVYKPTRTYQNVSKKEGLEKLTPARALIAELVRRYSVLGLECTNLEVHKLAWFLQASIRSLGLKDPLDLRFQPNKYGPYAERLRHLLNGLDGSYLHCRKRLSDAGPFDLIWFNDTRRSKVDEYLHSEKARTYLPALDVTGKLIDGYESPLGMELLATVDWLIHEDGYQPELSSIRRGLANWPGGDPVRKEKLFDDRLLQLALKRLNVATSTRENTKIS